MLLVNGCSLVFDHATGKSAVWIVTFIASVVMIHNSSKLACVP